MIQPLRRAPRERSADGSDGRPRIGTGRPTVPFERPRVARRRRPSETRADFATAPSDPPHPSEVGGPTAMRPVRMCLAWAADPHGRAGRSARPGRPPPRRPAARTAGRRGDGAGADPGPAAIRAGRPRRGPPAGPRPRAARGTGRRRSRSTRRRSSSWPEPDRVPPSAPALRDPLPARPPLPGPELPQRPAPAPPRQGARRSTTRCSSGSRRTTSIPSARAAAAPRARQPGGRPPRPGLPEGQRRRRPTRTGSPGSATPVRQRRSRSSARDRGEARALVSPPATWRAGARASTPAAPSSSSSPTAPATPSTTTRAT